MRKVTLRQLIDHPGILKYLQRSGLAHAVRVAELSYDLSIMHGVDPDLATKAGLLHDIGHYTWYTDGKWDYSNYRENDIHAIKGAARAHEYLIQLGEPLDRAKQIALAILLHTDSYLPMKVTNRSPLQDIIARADELDEEPKGSHHYRKMSIERAQHRLIILEHKVGETLQNFHIAR